jgi:hypothetical protein
MSKNSRFERSEEDGGEDGDWEGLLILVIPGARLCEVVDEHGFALLVKFLEAV